MATLPVVEIVSEKDATEKWIINESDFNPAKHTLWSQRDRMTPVPEEAAKSEDVVLEQPGRRSRHPGGNKS